MKAFYSQELKNKILNLIKERPLNYGQCCASSTYKQLGEEIKQAVPKLIDDSYKFKTRIYWILNDIFDFPKCEICGKDITRNILTLDLGYHKHNLQSTITCSENCRKIAIKQKIEATNIKRYGTKNVFGSNIIRQKIQETNIKRYGIANGGNTPEGRKKAKQTILKNFGNDGLKSKIIYERKKATNLERYGKESHTQTDEYKQRCYKKHLNGLIDRLKNDPEIELLNFKDIQNLKNVQEAFGKKFNFKCKKCGNIFFGKLNGNNFYKYKTYSSCNKCHPFFCTSKAEKEVLEWLITIYKKEILQNKRHIVQDCSELDIYIPEKHLAIEYDGLYWHSIQLGTFKNYHLNKTLACEKQGIQLIHIFENEWNFKQEIVKSRLKNLLGIYDKTVYARKCQIKEVDSKTSKEFQLTNHIQGAVNSKVSLGLYFEDKLVSLMTFGKCRFDKKHEWELLRFCNKLGYHIPGGASKLLRYFERNYQPKSLVSYADRRWSQGKVYENLGFTFSHASAPNYWYWKNLKLESRIKYQKHKLKDLLEIFDENKTEVENMRDNGYKQIYDCGNLVYEKIYNSII